MMGSKGVRLTWPGGDSPPSLELHQRPARIAQTLALTTPRAGARPSISLRWRKFCCAGKGKAKKVPKDNFLLGVGIIAGHPRGFTESLID